MTTLNPARWLDLVDKFQALFADASGERDKRRDSTGIDAFGHTEPEWMTFERQAMVDAANHELSTRGYALVDPQKVQMIEDLSTGADYAAKFPLRVARLVADTVGADL